MHDRIGFSEHSGDDEDDIDGHSDDPGTPIAEGTLVGPRRLERIERGREAVASLQRAGVSPDLFR